MLIHKGFSQLDLFSKNSDCAIIDTMRFSFNQGPKAVKFLITTTVGLSLFIALTAALPFVKYLILLLSITTFGAKHLFLWQLLTHIFIYPTGGLFSFNYLISLFFNLYFLWMVGTQIASMWGTRRFLAIYLGSGIVSGAVVMTLLAFFSTPFIYTGCHSALMGLVLAYAFLNREAQVVLFLTIPMKVKWLVAGLIGMEGLVAFANGNFIEFGALLSSLLYSYFYTLLTFETLSPYPALHRFEEGCLALKKKLFKRRRANFSAIHSSAKVYDFKTGEAILDDEAFVDYCLTKIAKRGKSSLTFFERIRLNRIAKRKARSQHP